MKTSLKLFALVSIISLFVLSGCQKEATEIIETPTNGVITSNSNVADLVQRTAMRDGSIDNIIDNSSCTTIELPITVVVNGLEIILDSEEDFETVENIIDKFDFDDDIIDIIFPVTVILADHSEIVLNNSDDLEALTDLCEEDGYDDDIECIDFVYPFTISVYSSDKQISEEITIENDKDLHELFDELEKEDIASFNFPITVLLPNGEEYIVSDNDELENLLYESIDACDEDDDNDYNDDDADDTELKYLLIDGIWEITYYFDEDDNTSIFEGYIFDFIDNYKVEASLYGSDYQGEWSTNGDDGTLELELYFDEEYPLDEISEDWDVIEIGETIIKLKQSDDDGSIYYLTLERTTNYDNGDDHDNLSIADIIINGKWIVAKYTDSGEDETSDYDGLLFDFFDDGDIIVTKNNDEIEGTWSISTDNDLEIFDLNFGDIIPLNEFNDDWKVVSLEENRFELHSVSGGDGTTDILVFEKENI